MKIYDIKNKIINAFEKNYVKPMDFKHNVIDLIKQKTQIKTRTKTRATIRDYCRKNKNDKKNKSDDKQPDITGMPDLESEESAEQIRNQKGLKTLTPGQMLSRLPISLAHLKAGNNKKKLKMK